MLNKNIEVEVLNPKTTSLDLGKSNEVVTPGGNKISLSFGESGNYFLDKKPNKVELEEKATEMFSKSYDYLLDVLGDDFSYFSEDFDLNLSTVFKGHGKKMKVDASLLGELIANPDDKNAEDLATSMFIHEIVHNLSNDEELPLLIEMTYLLEKKNSDRINDIREIYEGGTLPQEHTRGLEKISKWVGTDNSSELLKKMPGIEILELKKIFVKETTSYCEKEFKN